MDFLNEIENNLNENDFSIEMLDYCRLCFQYGGFNEKDKKVFTEMLKKKVEEFLPDLPTTVSEVLAKMCIDRGIQRIKDVLFIGDAIFSEKINDFSPIEGLSEIDFIGSTGKFENSDSVDFVWEFARSNIQEDKRKNFFQALHEIFDEYFNNSLFPEAANQKVLDDGCPWIRFAIDHKIDDIIKAFEENRQINFAIASSVNNTNSCCLVELECIPYEKEVLKVSNSEDSVRKLTTMIENKKSEYKKFCKHN